MYLTDCCMHILAVTGPQRPCLMLCCCPESCWDFVALSCNVAAPRHSDLKYNEGSSEILCCAFTRWSVVVRFTELSLEIVTAVFAGPGCQPHELLTSITLKTKTLVLIFVPERCMASRWRGLRTV